MHTTLAHVTAPELGLLTLVFLAGAACAVLLIGPLLRGLRRR